MTVLLVTHNNKEIAGVLTFLYKDTVLPYYGGALDGHLKMQPNNFMYLKLMEYGVEKGYKYFDFGRSKKGVGSYSFKKNQGFTPELLSYQYYLNSIDSIPDVSPMNPKIQLAIKVWKKLPVWVTKIIGPKIIRLTPP